jgi:hypothetical protein
MHSRWLASVIAIGSLPLVGCGGTGSETPEPVHPDSWQLKLRSQRQVSAAAQIDRAQNLGPTDDVEGNVQARSTWGTNHKSTRLGTKPSATLTLPDPTAPAESVTEPVKQESTPAAAEGRKAREEP